MDNFEKRFGGTNRLFGRAGWERLANAHVGVIGIGGVGSWAVEALARAGIGRMTLVDLDDICESNINRQVQALGQPGDVLLLVDPLGEEALLHAPIDAAQACEMSVVVLSARSSAALRERLGETDALVAVPHERAARVCEMQLLVLHCLCDAVELQLMGEQDPL